MKHVTFKPTGVCAQKIDFDIDDDNKIHNVSFERGCNGNLKAIGLLTEGMDAKVVMETLRGNQCGARGTSCADQFAIAISENI